MAIRGQHDEARKEMNAAATETTKKRTSRGKEKERDVVGGRQPKQEAPKKNIKRRSSLGRTPYLPLPSPRSTAVVGALSLPVVFVVLLPRLTRLRPPRRVWGCGGGGRCAKCACCDH